MTDINLDLPIHLAANKKTEKILKYWDIQRTINLNKRKTTGKVQLFYDYLELDPKKRESIRLEIISLAQ